jgi:hypothetical protein
VTRRRATPTFLALLATVAACAAPDDGPVEVRRELAGDTVVLTAVGAPDTVRVESVAVLWRSDALEQPTAMARVTTPAGETLLVGDPTRVHILALDADGLAGVTTVGREGDGPGEFRRVGAVGAIAPDTLAVWDLSGMRLTLLAYDGRLLDTRQLSATGEYRPWFHGMTLRLDGGDLLDVTSAPLAVGERNRIALVRRAMSGDSAVVVEEWPGPTWQVIGSGQRAMMASTHLFGGGTEAAVGPNGWVARGDGFDYCVTVFRVGAASPPRRLCRDRERTPLGSGIEDPDWSRIEDPTQREMFRTLHDGMELGDRLPSYDRLLWSELADVHPYFLALGVDESPDHRAWDVFDPEAGTLRTVLVPAALRPIVVDGGTIFGAYELPTGEIAVGKAAARPSAAGDVD